MPFRNSMAAVLLLLFCVPAGAQNKFYTLREKDAWTRTKKSYDFNEGDSIVFEKSRWILYHTDGTDERGTYAGIDAMYLTDPGIGLYKPAYLADNDFDDEASQYCFQRSMQSEHFILFWEAGFGSDPSKAASGYAFDPVLMLERAENIYRVNTQELGFSQPGDSKTLDNYKIMMFAHYTTTWTAYGSGQDDKVGTLDVNPAAIKDSNGQTLAHEIGHTFQYIIACDYGLTHGWRYGFGTNASGGCAWWESCAQWQAAKVYPTQQFQGYGTGYPSYSYMNLLHETPRYYNYFVQDYWCQLHGQDFIGRLWKESTKPEDPVEAYKRITGESQDDFCKDMYDYACRAITWDIDALRTTGKNRQDQFNTSMHDVTGTPYLEVDSINCPQNYGFNVIKLKNADAGTEVKANFRGVAGASGFRAINADKAGWRYGFVAQQTDGTRVYGDMFKDSEGVATFTIPENLSKLWFVVLGAPTEHWRHPWNDDVSDDEQWPYRVSFEGTDKPGHVYIPADYVRHDTLVTVNLTLDTSADTLTQTSQYTYLDMTPACEAFGISSSLFDKLSVGTQSDSLYVSVKDATGAETRETASQYSFSFYFTPDGQSTTDTDTAAYSILWSSYRYICYGIVVKDKVEVGQTYTGNLIFHYVHEGQEYTATYVIRLNVT